MTTSYTNTILHIAVAAICSFLIFTVFSATVSAAEPATSETPAEEITTRSTGDIQDDIRRIREKIAALEDKQRKEESAHELRVSRLQSQIAEVRGKLIQLRQENAVDNKIGRLQGNIVRKQRRSETAPELREVIGQPPVRVSTQRRHSFSHGDYFKSLRGEKAGTPYLESVKDAKERMKRRSHLRREIADIRRVIRTFGTPEELKHRHPETGKRMNATEVRQYLRERIASLRQEIRRHTAGTPTAPTAVPVRIAVPDTVKTVKAVRTAKEQNREKLLIEIRDTVNNLRKDIAELRAMQTQPNTEAEDDRAKSAEKTPVTPGIKGLKTPSPTDRLTVTPRDIQKGDGTGSSATMVTIIILAILLLLIGLVPVVQHWKKKKQQQNINQWKI